MSDTTNKLAVPIRIDALVVGKLLPHKDLFQWTNLTPDLYKFNGDYLLGSEPGLDKLFAEDKYFMPPGIHLHFRLPRAFKHGIQHDSGGISFPKIPNRWLVQRTCPAPDNKLNYKAWVIKSDAEGGKLTSRKPGVTWPEFPEGQPAVFKSIGQYIELSGSVDEEDEVAALELTAVGPGDPAFSAYYPACRSVLGFHDPLKDVPAGSRPSYLVTGWYSAAADDPLHGKFAADGSAEATTFAKNFLKNFRVQGKIPADGEFSAEEHTKLYSEAGKLSASEQAKLPVFIQLGVWLQERNWKCDALADVKQPPTRLVCHGSVRGVAWEGEKKNYLQASEQNASERGVDIFPLDSNTFNRAYRIAVGDAPGEALAALCKDGVVDQDLLTALQAGLLSQDVTISELRHELHGRRFGSVRGGTDFLIQPEPEGLQPVGATGQPPQPPADKGMLPEPLRNKLAYLSQAQTAFDHQARRVDDCIWQLYACWYLWTTECKGPGPKTDKAKLRKSQFDSFARLLDGEKQSLATAKSNRDTYKTNVENELKNYPRTLPDDTPKKNAQNKPALMYRLTESALQPFQEPNDPIIAIAGPAMEPLNTWQQIDALPCRLWKQPHREAGDDIATTLIGSKSDPGGIHRDLLDELIGPPRSPAANAFHGEPPHEIAAYDWKANPWIPLFLVWEVSWVSDYPSNADDNIAVDVIKNRWTLARSANADSEPDLVLKTEPPGTLTTAGTVAKYQGRSILTPSAAKSLADELEKLKVKHPLIDVLKNRPVMSQTLDGFHEALTRRRAATQLPPLEYPSKKPVNLDPDRTTFRTTPAATGPFLPIRAGRLRIEKLSVVDAFGQTVKLPVDEINAHSADMLYRAHNTIDAAAQAAADAAAQAAADAAAQAAAIASSKHAEIVLRPRFTRPMRLRFDLANAGKGAGPVCGWILPNYMEHSLAVYSAAGRPLGAFQKRLVPQAGDTAFYWVDFPRCGNGSIAATPDGHLLHFCDWVKGLSADQGASFSSLLDQSIEATDQRVPDEDPGVSVLVGRPLALVRASLQFEVPGIGAHSPELKVPSKPPKSVEDLIVTRGFEAVRWPVRLGDLRARNDGLVGVFACSSVDTTSGPFYPAWGQDEGDAVKDTFGTQDFTLDCAAPLHLTMLMDPQARVHATTGVLPRVSVELPSDVTSGAKRARDVFFQTAPVLGESSTPHMPRPSDDYGEWSWAYRPDVTNWREDPYLIEATDRGAFSGTWPAIAEGWLKLRIALVKVLSLWVREGTLNVAAGTRIHLAWSLQGAELLTLVEVKKDGTTALVKDALGQAAEWRAPAFPREYAVTIQQSTTYRLTATAEGAKPSSKEITIEMMSSDVKNQHV